MLLTEHSLGIDLFSLNVLCSYIVPLLYAPSHQRPHLLKKIKAPLTKVHPSYQAPLTKDHPSYQAPHQRPPLLSG